MNNYDQPITVGIAGLGRAGWGIHVRDLRDDKRFKIIAVVEPDADRARHAVEELGCKSYATLDALLADSDAELIVVATPNIHHESDAIAVLNAGRHCILEKPMALSYEGGLRLQVAAELAGKLLAVNHVHLFREEYHFLSEVIASGVLGELFEIRFDWSSFNRRNDWQTLLKNGGGHLGNHGTHALSILLPLLGAPVKSLLAQVRHIKDAGDADDHAHLLMEAENGRIAQLIVSTSCAFGGPKFTLLGSLGSLTDAGGGGKVKLRYCDPASITPLEAIDGAAIGRKYGTGEVLAWKEELRPIAINQPCASFKDAVVASIRNDAPFSFSVEDALEVVRVIEWAYTGCDPRLTPDSSTDFTRMER